ncbi:MAG: aldehyde dehydrogenase (NADP(+)), partial [Flavobacteriaceae bacterium]|nr:aldehyde dehydrogenase (NADP(+)) [Flavobacteriaceae bacterium]
MITGKNYIGDNLSSNSSVTFQTFNPKLNIENDITFYEASDSEIQKSVELAFQAFKKYKLVSSEDKSKFLNQIADELQLISNDIVNIYCSETGLTEARCLAELTRTINQLRSFSELLINGDFQEVSIDTSVPDRVPVPKPDLRKMLMPLGPVAVFGASNFPLA